MKNGFCVNDKVLGSVWGNVKTWDEMKVEIAESNTEIAVMRILDEWNGKRYVFMRNDDTSTNYFVEI